MRDSAQEAAHAGVDLIIHETDPLSPKIKLATTIIAHRIFAAWNKNEESALLLAQLAAAFSASLFKRHKTLKIPIETMEDSTSILVLDSLFIMAILISVDLPIIDALTAPEPQSISYQGFTAQQLSCAESLQKFYESIRALQRYENRVTQAQTHSQAILNQTDSMLFKTATTWQDRNTFHSLLKNAHEQMGRKWVSWLHQRGCRLFKCFYTTGQILVESIAEQAMGITIPPPTANPELTIPPPRLPGLGAGSGAGAGH